jgi:hypothetical protein
MKLFVVTCLKEYQEDVYKIFKQASINIFSVTGLTGIKNNQPHNILADWFASGDEKFDSLMVFSFTTGENAELGMELIKKFNEESKPDFLIRAFIVPVEKSI